MVANIQANFQRTLADMQKWGRQVQAHAPTHEKEIAQNLLDTINGATPETLGETKKDVRELLWDIRRNAPEGCSELRHSYEKLRNLALDSSYPQAAYTVRPSACEVPNFQVIRPNYLRGGQPDQEGLQWLAGQGVKTTVDLRGSDRDNAWDPPTRYPLQVIRVAVEDFQAPTFQQVEEFIQIVNEPANQPVYVHCKAGVGRTGVMTACWRISQGMTAAEALEAERINSQYGTLKQEHFVRDFETYWNEKNSAAR